MTRTSLCSNGTFLLLAAEREPDSKEPYSARSKLFKFTRERAGRSEASRRSCPSTNIRPTAAASAAVDEATDGKFLNHGGKSITSHGNYQLFGPDARGSSGRHV
jgi:hypothetical protein